MNYKQARKYCYPNINSVLEALYPLATGGDSTKKAAIDAHIAAVHTGIPADSTTYTTEQLDTKITEWINSGVFVNYYTL
tara:strand:+ start:700 stop:936 length:237 start_codon:yes stop_codon:yes gene_type:complete